MDTMKHRCGWTWSYAFKARATTFAYPRQVVIGDVRV